MKGSKHALCVLFSVLFLVLGFAPGAASADIEEGLLLYWNFDEGEGTTAGDGTGNNRDGTLVGDPQWVASREGLGTALDFGGDGDHVVAENAAGYLDGLSELTIALWIKSDVTGTDSGFIIFQDPAGGDSRDIRYDAAGASGNGTNLIKYGIPSTGGGEQDESSSSVQTTEWQHITLTWASGAGLSLYINGVLDTPQFNDPAQTGTTSGLSKVIVGQGGKDTGAADGWDGLVDEVRIYNRALTLEEIDELYKWTGHLSTAGPDQLATAGETVTLYGAGPPDATSFSWTQTGGQGHLEPALQPSPNDPQVSFSTPVVEVGYLLTFELTVVSDSEGTITDEVQAYVYAPNVPKVAPTNLRLLPMDFGLQLLGFRLTWDPVFDADRYQIGLKLGDMYFWQYNATEPFFDMSGMAESQEVTVVVRGENEYSSPNPQTGDHGVPSEDVTYRAMPNVAVATGPTPPSEYVTVIDPSPTGMNNGAADDHSDSNTGVPKPEDYWGYLWDQPLFFDHIVYHTGQFSANGGWFTSLKVQVTQDGTTWTTVPGATIMPAYDFTDTASGRTSFARYDIVIPPTRGKGIRISGSPGGTLRYTSIAELEVFGDQTRPGDFILAYGVDGEVPEGGVGILDGTASFSVAGDIVSYAWSGPVAITDADKAMASFDADIVDADTELVFSLTVEDSASNTATDDDVRITVRNLVTTAVAGPNQRVPDGSEVTLDASASLSTTGTLTYLWTQTQGTLVGVTGSTTETVTFTAPVLWGHREELTFQLDVDDGAGGTSTDEVVIEVRNSLIAPVFDLEPFDSADWQFFGIANYNEPAGILEITPTVNYQTGAAWLNEPIDCTRFRARFKIYIGDGNGADGMVFGWVRDPAMGDTGGALGWYGAAGPSGYAIVFDTYPNPDVNMVSFEDSEVHTTVDNGGFVNYTPPIDLENSGWFDVEIEMDNGHLQVWMSNEDAGFARELAIDYTLAGYEGFPAYFGFTGATGGLNNNQWVDDLPLDLADAYATRTLPLFYEAGGSMSVELSLRVNPDNTPGSVNILEKVPAGISDSDVTAPGAVVSGGNIIWTLSDDQVETGTLSYSMNVPGEMTQGMDFSGMVSYGTTTSDVFGQDVVYGVPSAPGYVEAEMLAAAHLSWSAPAEEGVREYTIYRSENGGAWQEVATVTGTSYVDMSVVSGINYSYQVSAVNVRGVEGSASAPTEQASLPTMEIRETEDFNYGGGEGPWTPGTTTAAERAPGSTDLDAQYDYFFADTTRTNTYRPNDPVDVRNYGTAEDPRWFMGYNNTPGNWWRYNFQVPVAGWVKVVVKVASPNDGTIQVFWDEELVGTVPSFYTGGGRAWIWFPLEDTFQSTAGLHVLRLYHASGGAVNFDTLAVGYDWTPPKRKTIWEEDFEAYASTQEVIDNGGWQIINGSTDPDTGDPAPNPDAAWQWWNVDTMISGESGDIAGMDGNYMLVNSDNAGAGFLLDEELISPEIDCAGWTKLRLVFNKNYRMYDDPDHMQNADTDIRVFDSVTGWGGWVTLFHLDTTSVPAGLDPPILSGAEQIDLSVYDGKRIQLRWRFYDAEFDYWFAVDSIVVSGIQPEGPAPRITGWTFDGTNVSITWDEFGDGTYYVEYTTDLTSGVWDTVAGPLTETTWSTEMPGDAFGFARIRSAAP